MITKIEKVTCDVAFGRKFFGETTPVGCVTKEAVEDKYSRKRGSRMTRRIRMYCK